MGGAVSAGRDNNSLVDNLVASDYIKSEIVERVFRAVDRADYFLPESRRNAYKDLAWRSGDLHISAPCIYSDVMEWLKLRAGLSFLNLGSGTGYLSTMAGLILGTGGTNHGVELHADVVEYAIEKLDDFIASSTAIDEFDFCFPKFVVGNCLCLSSLNQQYDRVYCGAACPKTYENNLKNLIKIGGILVMPVQGKLIQIKRKSDTEWVSKNIQHVSFASLVTPAPDNHSSNVYIGDITPPSLQELCRWKIRSILRTIVYEEKPHIKSKPARKKRESVQSRERDLEYTRLSLPIRDDESDSGEFDFSILHNLDRDTGSREMNTLLRLVLSMRRDVGEIFYPQDRGGDQANVNQEDDSDDARMNESLSDANDSTFSNNEDPDSNRTAENSLSNLTDDAKESITDANNPNDEFNNTQMNNRLQAASSTSNPESGLDSPSSSTKHPGGSTKHERKRHYSEGDEEEETDESLSESDNEASSHPQCDRVKKMKRKSPPPLNEWDMKRKELSDCLREKVNQLPLPMSLKVYINMNRQI